MEKKYAGKRIKNLYDLEKERIRIRKKARQLEKDFIQLLDPKQLATEFLTSFISKKLSGKKNIFSTNFALANAQQKIGKIATQPIVNRTIKKIAKSVISWQMLRLLYFFGKKAIPKLIEKHKENSICS